jgi:hypothetical protein
MKPLPFVALIALLFVLPAKFASGAATMFFDPASGNIRIDQSECTSLILIRTKGAFNPDIALAPPITTPSAASAPLVSLIYNGTWLTWRPANEPVFGFNSLILYGAIPPDDDYELLSFGYQSPTEAFPVWVPINIVPEPSSVVLVCFGLFGLAALRRRK